MPAPPVAPDDYGSSEIRVPSSQIVGSLSIAMAFQGFDSIMRNVNPLAKFACPFPIWQLTRHVGWHIVMVYVKNHLFPSSLALPIVAKFIAQRPKCLKKTPHGIFLSC